MRVVLDTNVVVSAFLAPRGAPTRVFEQWRLDTFEILVSEPILAEYQRALSYTRVQSRHRMTAAEIAQVVEDIRQFAVTVDVPACPAVVPEDPEDDKFLACAAAGGATYVVSGDVHLLRLQEHQGMPILSPAAFLAVLRALADEEQAPRE